MSTPTPSQPDDAQLSRAVSHALRHEPWVYELELDAAGWTPVPALLAGLREQGPGWAQVDRADLEGMIARSAKQRHELDGDRIRACYGHSVPGRIEHRAASPPDVLFHGTSSQAWQAIRVQGLHPSGRQYVHLSSDLDTARSVGARKSGAPVLLQVDAAAAVAAGTRFWHGNDRVWLALTVAADHLHELEGR